MVAGGHGLTLGVLPLVQVVELELVYALEAATIQLPKMVGNHAEAKISSRNRVEHLAIMVSFKL